MAVLSWRFATLHRPSLRCVRCGSSQLCPLCAAARRRPRRCILRNQRAPRRDAEPHREVGLVSREAEWREGWRERLERARPPRIPFVDIFVLERAPTAGAKDTPRGHDAGIVFSSRYGQFTITPKALPRSGGPPRACFVAVGRSRARHAVPATLSLSGMPNRARMAYNPGQSLPGEHHEHHAQETDRQQSPCVRCPHSPILLPPLPHSPLAPFHPRRIAELEGLQEADGL